MEKQSIWTTHKWPTRWIPISCKAITKIFSRACFTAIHLNFEGRFIKPGLDVKSHFSCHKRRSDVVFYHSCGVCIPHEHLCREKKEDLLYDSYGYTDRFTILPRQNCVCKLSLPR